MTKRLKTQTQGIAVKGQFVLGDLVRKKSGGWWHGRVVGFYSTELTPVGYCVESYYERGSVQIYPEKALEPWDLKEITVHQN